jgi:hypothetical protein
MFGNQQGAYRDAGQQQKDYTKRHPGVAAIW